MRRGPLTATLVAYLLMQLVANGIGSIWPVYLAQLGAGPAVAGYFIATSALALLLGTLAGGWLMDRFQAHRRLYLLACLACSASWYLMLSVHSVLALGALTGIASFARAIGMNVVFVLTGLLAGKHERGRQFGLLTLVQGVSMLVGGAVAGPLADQLGFHSLLLANGIISGLCLVPGLFFVDAQAPKPEAQLGRPNEAGSSMPALGPTYLLLMSTTLMASLAYHMALLGRTVAMTQLGYAATAISLTTVIAGAVSLPAPVALGWLADRGGRLRPLLIGWLTGLAAILTLAGANAVWTFWLAAALMAVMSCAFAIGSALATDVLPPASLGKGLSLLWAVVSGGYLLGSVLMGQCIEWFGVRPAFLVSAAIGLLAVALLLPLRQATRLAGIAPQGHPIL